MGPIQNVWGGQTTVGMAELTGTAGSRPALLAIVFSLPRLLESPFE